MVQEALDKGEGRPPRRKRRWLRNGAWLLLILMVLVLSGTWLERKEIADSFIADTLAQNDIRATYTVESIGPQQQVLTDIVIGDPASPDLTIERLELGITPRFGLPDLTELVLVRPRLFGSYRDGQLSFGDLDPLIFTETDAPPEFPDARLVIDDGRGLLDTDYGRVGLKIAGGGHLRGGFNAEVAAVAQELALPGCTVSAPTLYGTLSIDDERPHFVGPVRFETLGCPGQDLAIADGAVEIDVLAARDLAEFEGEYRLGLGRGTFAGSGADTLGGEGRFSWRDGAFNALYDLAASGVQTPAAFAQELALEGRVRATQQFERVEIEGEVAGSGLRAGQDFDAQLASAQAASEGTLAAPLLAKLRGNLAREMRGSTFSANFDARRIGDLTSLVIPEARLRGGSGASLLSLSRTTLTIPAQGLPRFSGNLATGGNGLPRVTGRMEQAGNGALTLRLSMDEYASGNARLAIPELTVLQSQDGRVALEGRVLASGPLPGGFAQGLVLPIDGTIANNGALALWNGCRNIGFDRLEVSGLTLARQALTLCPQTGAPILRYGPGGVQFAAGVPSLELAGQLGESPIRLTSGAVGVAWPGALSANDLDIVLGPADNAQRFTISSIQALLSPGSINGSFTGADVTLASVPLDILESDGKWRFVDGRLELSEASFVLEDREATDRFERMVANGATLSLIDSLITAQAVLRHPATNAALSRVEIAHNLTTSTGHADLMIDGVTFGPDLQPAPPASHCLRPDLAARVAQNGLSCLALGVVSEVSGTVTGTGRIDWNAQAVTSRGTFSSTSLDLAAAFGPVDAASGTVEFTDLLGLTTAPDQRIRIGAINPGIEVYDGEVGFQMVNGERLTVTGGSWPFMGGQLIMQPVEINIGVAESRTYVMEIVGLQASQFIERMEMGNLAANGTFDGVIPIVFDADGNGQLVAGELTSRDPGGSLSYVGDLTYEDMSFFANYAFAALRDLRYNRMEIAMDGPLTGELVTRVRFTGIGQGESAESNFVTRAIARVPIDLRINIRAPFYKLMTSLRAMYDPAALRDPRALGLLRDDGVRLRETIDQEAVDEADARAAEAEALGLTPTPNNPSPNNDEPDIQPPESEAMR